MTNAAQSPNADQAEYWNAANGAAWVRLQGVLDDLFAPVADAVVTAGFPGEGGQVLDVGCGAGATTLAMARRLGSQGGCLGVDISEPLVVAARERAGVEDAPTARFIVADAQTHDFEAGRFDAAISRFGVMFFDDPTTAFGNIRRAMKPGARLAFAAWRMPDENPFMTAGARAAAAFQPDLPRHEPDAPGQFGFSRAARIDEVLTAAGWADLDIRAWDAPGVLTRDDMNAFITQMGATGMVLRGLEEPRRSEAARAILAACEPFVRDGVARFPMGCWLVTARA